MIAGSTRQFRGKEVTAKAPCLIFRVAERARRYIWRLPRGPLWTLAFRLDSVPVPSAWSVAEQVAALSRTLAEQCFSVDEEW
jgi:hypothetical protein